MIHVQATTFFYIFNQLSDHCNSYNIINENKTVSNSNNLLADDASYKYKGTVQTDRRLFQMEMFLYQL